MRLGSGTLTLPNAVVALLKFLGCSLDFKVSSLQHHTEISIEASFPAHYNSQYQCSTQQTVDVIPPALDPAVAEVQLPPEQMDTLVLLLNIYSSSLDEAMILEL